LGAAVVEDVPEQSVVCNHRGNYLTTKHTKHTKKKFLPVKTFRPQMLTNETQIEKWQTAL